MGRGYDERQLKYCVLGISYPDRLPGPLQGADAACDECHPAGPKVLSGPAVQAIVAGFGV